MKFSYLEKVPQSLKIKKFKIAFIFGWFIFPLVSSLIFQFTFLMKPHHEFAFGVYDPVREFVDPTILIEHHFVTWRLNDANELIYALEQVKKANRFPLISIEPWPWEWGDMVRDTLLQDIVWGKYDATIERILKVIQQQAPQKVLLRWGHEMEIINQYPWSHHDPQTYIQAYRYIVDFARNLGINNILWVWSPAGNKEAMLYWPGQDYVDFIGVSIYADKKFNSASQQNNLPSFKSLMSEKYWFADYYHKPMIVAEFGVDGSDREKRQWLTSAIKNVAKFPQVKALIYFNQIQPDIVPLAIGQPNWELTTAQIDILTQTWQKFNRDRLSSENIDLFLDNHLNLQQSLL
jgi:beta-mannanase